MANRVEVKSASLPSTTDAGSTFEMSFSGTIQNAYAAINGFFLNQEGKDRHTRKLYVGIDQTTWAGNKVSLAYTCCMKDDDHDASGSMNIIIFAEIPE